MSHNYRFEKLTRALQLHEDGLPNWVIGERLGISTQQAARTVIQAKERRTKRAAGGTSGGPSFGGQELKEATD